MLSKEKRVLKIELVEEEEFLLKFGTLIKFVDELIDEENIEKWSNAPILDGYCFLISKKKYSELSKNCGLKINIFGNKFIYKNTVYLGRIFYYSQKVKSILAKLKENNYHAFISEKKLSKETWYVIEVDFTL
ncbi:hypothetical protein [Clostridium estertheticum]|uniref:hypothetical protein n=1 Tax=Clostridium estertheticum TaxID=238834 RepID=UPI001C0CC119|nr:hypothetical protein [Clostridium estertheticum]MBU3173356.1 hypothetical protein [Clostridium estertheticum]